MELKDDILQAAAQLGSLLKSREDKLATAESCTGGWIAKICTDIAGSSDWFDMSVVSYSNEAKMRILKVAEQTLDDFGAVSEQTVAEMVAGALACSNADIAVAVSGIAGPGGGSDDKPVGTVWFAWCLRGEAAQAELAQFEGSRDQVRRQAVAFAIQGCITRLESS